MSDIETLPEGWESVSLQNVLLKIVGGGTPSKKIHSYYQGNIPWFSVKDMKSIRPTDSLQHITEDAITESATNLIPANTIVMATRIALGKAIKPTIDFTINQDLKALFLPIGMNSNFVLYWIIHNEKKIYDLGSGTTVKGITLETLNNLEFLLPPEKEQIRIVEKLEELLSDLDNGVAELKAAQTKLTQYRQSLLKSAVEGSLTAEWRKQNPATETGEQLLQRILSERLQRWEQQKLAEFKEKGKTPPKDWQKKYPEPVKPDASELPGLPEGWVWASVDQLVLESSYGTSVKCDYVSKNTAVLRIPNVAKKKLDISDLKFSTQDLGLSDDKYLKDGDILIVRTNGSISLVGQTALFRGEFDKKFYFASYLLRLRPILTNTLSEWMDSFFGSMPARKWIEKNASSSAGQNNISLSTFSTLAVPLPPLEEQKILIRQLGSVFENCNTQLSNNEYGLQQAEAQRKNILKAAFSGQLVPQNSNDESASALLEKIKAERAIQNKKQPTRRKKKAVLA